MKPVKVKNVEIGTGVPKICVPIVGRTKDEILSAAQEIRRIGTDVVEWRGDWYEDIFHFSKTEETLKGLREILGDIPLLFTFRTGKEGGEKTIDIETYVKLNESVAGTGHVDLIDVELMTGETKVKQITAAAHRYGIKVIASNHDFDQTPDKEEILSRLIKMVELGADIPKIAVMPQNRKDVLTLLSATEEMTSRYEDVPVITMSMSGTGVISRICGEIFGSSLTFGAVGKVSAPGQMGADDLRTVLNMLHNSI
jgi:3-dehydroquinate dehydratase-1